VEQDFKILSSAYAMDKESGFIFILQPAAFGGCDVSTIQQNLDHINLALTLP